MSNCQEKEPIYKEISREIARRNDISRDIHLLYNNISEIVFKIEGLKQVQGVVDETVARLRALIQESNDGVGQAQTSINDYSEINNSPLLQKKSRF